MINWYYEMMSGFGLAVIVYLSSYSMRIVKDFFFASLGENIDLK